MGFQHFDLQVHMHRNVGASPMFDPDVFDVYVGLIFMFWKLLFGFDLFEFACGDLDWCIWTAQRGNSQ